MDVEPTWIDTTGCVCVWVVPLVPSKSFVTNNCTYLELSRVLCACGSALLHERLQMALGEPVLIKVPLAGSDPPG